MIDALQKLHPSLNVTMPKVSIIYKDNKILIDGQSRDVVAARAMIETIMADIVVAPHSSPLSPIMCHSLKKNLKDNDVNAVIISESDVHYVCAANQDAFQYAADLLGNPYNVTVTAPSSNGFESLHFMEVQEIEQEYLVEVMLKGNQAHICGFVQSDIDQAKNVLAEKARRTKVIKRKLNCAGAIACYVHHTLFMVEQPLKDDPFVGSLQMKIISENGEVMIEGEEALLSQEESKLINRCIPQDFIFKSITYNDHDAKFGQQIEQDYLSPLRQYRFTSIVTSHSPIEPSKYYQKKNQPKKQHRPTSSQKGFTLTLYSTSQSDLEHAFAAIEVIFKALHLATYIVNNTIMHISFTYSITISGT